MYDSEQNFPKASMKKLGVRTLTIGSIKLSM